MKPNEIKAALMLKGIKQGEIARMLGITAAAVSSVIAGRYKSKRVKLQIAKILSKSINEIWQESA